MSILPHNEPNQFTIQTMARLKKADLEQMDETYFESLEPKRLVEVAKNLHELAADCRTQVLQSFAP
jgi:hypothetical protein